jgi:hypothetical protein
MCHKPAVEIRVLHVQRFIFGPFVQPHLLYEAKIEDLGVVRSDRCLVCVWMKMIAGEIHAFITIFDVFITRASEYRAWIAVAQKQYRTLHISASVAACHLYRQLQSLRDAFSETYVFVSEICGAIETIQSAW